MRWAAADFRADTTAAQLSVTYFGMITQNTGEDWVDARLVLSTATPQVVGVAPKLPSQHVTIRPKFKPRAHRMRMERER